MREEAESGSRVFFVKLKNERIKQSVPDYSDVNEN